jgi:hypothetical protein
VGAGVAIPPHEITDYASDQIPADYAVVIVSWVVPGFEEHDLEIPTPNGVRFLGAAICLEVLWNKEDILLELPKPVSQPSEHASSPPDPDDSGGNDYDDGDDDKGKNGGPPKSPPPPNSLPPTS